jgi:hypothetical protein
MKGEENVISLNQIPNKLDIELNPCLSVTENKSLN